MDTQDTVTGHVRQALQDAASRRQLAAVARRAGVAWVTARDIAAGITLDPRASVLERLGRAAGLGDLRWVPEAGPGRQIDA
jgi:hypothetical protein